MEKQNIRIKLRAYDNKILDQSTAEIVNTVKRTGANIKPPPAPTKTPYIPVPKPKKSRGIASYINSASIRLNLP